MTEKEFTEIWVEKIKNKLKSFPGDFLVKDDCEVQQLPGKALFMPPPLFNSYQVIDEAGETIYATNDQYRAKYVIYANRTKPTHINIPKTDLRVYEVVRDYEKHLDKFLKEMETDFKQYYPNSKSFKRISAQVFNTLNLLRH